MAVVLLAGGVLTDRLERRKMMIAADLVRRRLAWRDGSARDFARFAALGTRICSHGGSPALG